MSVMWNGKSLLIQTIHGISVLHIYFGQLCHHSHAPVYLLFVNSKELVFAEMSETTTWHSARPHWVAMLTNALMVQKWVKIYIFPIQPNLKHTVNVPPTSTYFIMPAEYFPAVSLKLWFLHSMLTKFCLRNDWIRAILSMSPISAKQLKKPNSPKRSKTSQNTNSNYSTIR